MKIYARMIYAHTHIIFVTLRMQFYMKCIEDGGQSSVSLMMYKIQSPEAPKKAPMQQQPFEDVRLSQFAEPDLHNLEP